jgi:hypothetical protein
LKGEGKRSRSEEVHQAEEDGLPRKQFRTIPVVEINPQVPSLNRSLTASNGTTVPERRIPNSLEKNKFAGLTLKGSTGNSGGLGALLNRKRTPGKLGEGRTGLFSKFNT